MKWPLLFLVLLFAMPASAFTVETAHLQTEYGQLSAIIGLDRNNEDDLKIAVFIPEIGYFSRRGPLSDNLDAFHLQFYEPLPAVHGEYLAQITLFSNDEAQIVYRYVFI